MDGALEAAARELRRLAGARPEAGTPEQPLGLCSLERTTIERQRGVGGVHRRIVADRPDGPHPLSGCPRRNYPACMAAPTHLHFTGDDEADRLLARDPLALLIGFCLDQQVTVQKAFAGPLELQRRLGSLDAAQLAGMDRTRWKTCSGRSRRSTASPARWRGGCRSLPRDRLATTAATPRGVADAADAEDLRRRLGALPGFGEMKVKVVGAVLASTSASTHGRRARPETADARRRRLARGAGRVPVRQARPEGRGSRRPAVRLVVTVPFQVTVCYLERNCHESQAAGPAACGGLTAGPRAPLRSRMPRATKACRTVAVSRAVEPLRGGTVRFARSVIVVPSEVELALEDHRVGLRRAERARMSQSARDQIWPSWCTSPFRSSG